MMNTITGMAQSQSLTATGLINLAYQSYPTPIAQDAAELTPDEIYEVGMKRCPDCGTTLVVFHRFAACPEINSCGSQFRFVTRIGHHPWGQEDYVPKFRLNWPKDPTLAAINLAKTKNQNTQETLPL